MRARCARPCTCICIRSCPGRNHRSSAIKRATSAPGVSIGAFAARRWAHHTRSPRAMNQERWLTTKGDHLQKSIAIRRLLIFFLVFTETKINIKVVSWEATINLEVRCNEIDRKWYFILPYEKKKTIFAGKWRQDKNHRSGKSRVQIRRHDEAMSMTFHMFEWRTTKNDCSVAIRQKCRWQRRTPDVIALAGKRQVREKKRTASLFRTRAPPVVKMNFTQNLFRSAVDASIASSQRQRDTVLAVRE